MNAAVTICNSQIALQASADALNLNLILLQIDIDLMQISTDFRGRRYIDGTYGFDFYDFTFCPCCGCLMPFPLKKLKGFFEVYNIHSALLDAIQLIYKSEFESAAREAFVALENYFKKKSGLDSHGFDLVTRALSFEIDKQTGEIKRAPLIAINDLKNESQRNEGEYHCAS